MRMKARPSRGGRCKREEPDRAAVVLEAPEQLGVGGKMSPGKPHQG